MVRAPALSLLALSCLAALAGCASLSRRSVPPGPAPMAAVAPELQAIRVTPATAAAAMGQAVELTAVGISPQGEAIAITPEWRVQGMIMGLVSPAVGPTVVFTPKKNGIAFVEARQGNVRSVAKVMVGQTASPKPKPDKSKKRAKK